MLELDDPDAYDAAVSQTKGIDRWCSSTDWVLPLSTSMRPGAPSTIRTPSGWGVFETTTDIAGRRILMGVDRIWGFACPVIGGAHVWTEVVEHIADDEPDLIVVQGLVEESEAWHRAIGAFAATHALHRVGGIVRCQADLGGGLDSWMTRRSGRFRQRVRRVVRETDEAGVEVVDVTGTADEVLDRLRTIEATSWKGADDDALASPDMADFYARVLTRLGPERTRCLVARRDGNDVGYVVGGVRGPTYRGLQLSFSEGVRHLGVGHLLQFRQIEALCDEGITTYDLGMDMEYKHRWSDRLLATTTVVATPPG